MKKIRKKNLFTLLEVLVSMGVFSLLMLALMQFFSAAQGVWEKSGSKAELFDSARVASQLLSDDLTTAFYGDEYHIMGDAADKYIFFKTENDSDGNTIHLTFAAQRGGDQGLTEVDYAWNQAELTLSVAESKENDSDKIGDAGWVTYPSNAWIANIKSKTANAIAENVLYFNIQEKRVDGDENRPPQIVLATFAMLNSAGYEKLTDIIKASSPSATEETIKSTIWTYFKDMAPVNSSTNVREFSKNAVPESGSDVPAKQIIFDNVQFFKLIIPIER